MKVFIVLVDMYMKCFFFEEVYVVFFRILRKDVVFWVVLISGFILNGMVYRLVEEFFKMLFENNMRFDFIFMVKVFKLCLDLGFFE